MSRSYKRTPVYQEGYGTKSLQWYKRHANKKVRRTAEIADGKAYQKVYETWIFRDYTVRKTLIQYKTEFESNLDYCLRIYGSIDNSPRWLKREHTDKHYKLWKKRYYWK